MLALISHFKILSAHGAIPGLVWALSSDGEGNAHELAAGTHLIDTGRGWHWLHFNLADQQAGTLLDELPGMPRPAATLLKSRDEIPQIHFDGAVAYGVIADLQRNIGSTHEDTGLLHFVMSERLLITGRRAPLAAVGAIHAQLLEGRKIADVDALLAAIVEQVLDGVDVHLEQISREVDGLEDRILTGQIGDARGRLARHRRTSVRLRRHISELRLLFQRLERESKRSAIPAGLVTLGAQLLHDSEQLDRDIVALGDRTRLLQDEVATLLTEETNKHLRVLSVLTILFMPPTFIAGLFGMNLRGMMFEGHELGFWGATGLAIASSAAVLWVLKRAGILTR